MLTESHLGRNYANLLCKELGACHKVAKGLVIHQTLCYSLPDGHKLGFSAPKLVILPKQLQLLVCYHVELVMILVLGVYKMLNLCHAKFSHTNQSSSWRYFISESQANLSCSKWHLLAVEVQKAFEVDKEPLSCLWPQVAHRGSFRTNGCLEHEVERVGLAESCSRRRRFDPVLLEDLVDFLGAVRVCLALHQPMLLHLSTLHSRVIINEFINKVFQ
mmetsp:Transcript_29931/g.39332  ORF Transcript_29931/g.39332 Transcript_29931/m.39332 type:complete len:217 (+) Transcript_29931:1287-1937(+)